MQPNSRTDALHALRMTMRPARIWVVSKGQMSEWMHKLESQYRGRAHIAFIDETFEAALTQVRELEAQQAVDVIVTAGANAAYLRRLVRSPIAQVHISGFDVFRALARAAAIGEKIALMTHEDLDSELTDLHKLVHLPIAITIRRYDQPVDAESTMRELIEAGHRVFVGPSLITSLAERLGVSGVFVYSEHSLCQALDEAIELATISFEQQWRRAQLETVLERIDQGVVGVDMNCRVWTINARMEHILGISRDWALGKPLDDVSPGLGLQLTLRSGVAEVNVIERIGAGTVVVNRIPLLSEGQVTGAVLTCQEAGTVRKAEEAIRRDARPRIFRARYRLGDVVGDSLVMSQLRAKAKLWAASGSTILITGESGTGKEMLAQGIHQASARRSGPFVAINCAAIPETLLESELFGHEENAFTGARRGGRAGLIESAHRGTLFLDEVTEMPLSAQARLLRVLQEREVLRVGATETIPVDLRFVAATNRNPAQLIADGLLRPDLYFRLNVLRLAVPPLRARLDDIPAIARRWLTQSAREAVPEQWLEGCMPMLMRYQWPGNVRELENLLERLLACATTYSTEPGELSAGLKAELSEIAPELFEEPGRVSPGKVSGSTTLRASQISAVQIRHALEQAGGNISQAAHALGVSRTTLWRIQRRDREDAPSRRPSRPHDVSKI